MGYAVGIKDNCVVVNLSGEIDLTCSDAVRKILLDTVVKTPLTLVDLSDVRVIDSSGISSLLDGEQTAKRRGNKIELVNPSPQVLRVLRLAQLDRYFTIRQG